MKNDEQKNPRKQLTIFVTMAGFVQWVFMSLIYERFFQHQIQQFVDLCSISNVSVFILETEFYGYYIHGRSVHGRADTGLREMHENFVREEARL